MSVKALPFIAVLSIIFLHPFTMALAEEQHSGHNTHKAHEIQLSDDLKAILREEMMAIADNMAKLTHEIAYGNWDNIAEIAKRIEGSFIMKQKLSKDQINELHDKLPPGFRELDDEFHKAAGMLAHVAKERHSDLVSFYFYKLTDSCMKCHSKYAESIFPNFVKQNGHR